MILFRIIQLKQTLFKWKIRFNFMSPAWICCAFFLFMVNTNCINCDKMCLYHTTEDSPIISIPSYNFDFLIRQALKSHYGYAGDQADPFSYCGCSLRQNNLEELRELGPIVLDLNGDIRGIENLVGLEYLDLNSNNITEISLLAGLDNLLHLDLSFNNLTDIMYFADNFSCINSTKIILAGNPLGSDDNADIQKLISKGCIVTPEMF